MTTFLSRLVGEAPDAARILVDPRQGSYQIGDVINDDNGWVVGQLSPFLPLTLLSPTYAFALYKWRVAKQLDDEFIPTVGIRRVPGVDVRHSVYLIELVDPDTPSTREWIRATAALGGEIVAVTVESVPR